MRSEVLFLTSTVLAFSLGLALVVYHPTKTYAQNSQMRACRDCHPDIYASYVRHGMARSLGPVDTLPKGEVRNPQTGWRYQLVQNGKEGVLIGHAPDGGQRQQRIVGRIGAGILDTSWVTSELNLEDGKAINRLFFAPVETVKDHGLELSPFEHSKRPAHLNLALTGDCLTCHTDSIVLDLPGVSKSKTQIYPSHALGINAFKHIRALGCNACHGDTQPHLQYMTGDKKAPSSILKLSNLSATQKTDICAQCHLQGDIRFELINHRTKVLKRLPLGAQVPVLVANGPPQESFRFVSQVERLAASMCFKKSPRMTCISCHDPHQGVKQQGLVQLEKACLKCHKKNLRHEATCIRPTALTIEDVTGQKKARTPYGCIDCHLRRSEPFDLPGIRSADHFIRRRIPLPSRATFRELSRPGYGFRLWGETRLKKVLSTSGGQRWRRGLLAMALSQTGQSSRAAPLFAQFAAPGQPDAVRPTAPPPLIPLETWPSFHQLRALNLLEQGQKENARAAFEDVLRLDPTHAGGLLSRARLALIQGDFKQVMFDTQKVIENYPEAEEPWRLRVWLAERLGSQHFQIKGLEELLARWPSDAHAWLKLAQLYGQAGDPVNAGRALQRVKKLSPGLLKP